VGVRLLLAALAVAGVLAGAAFGSSARATDGTLTGAVGKGDAFTISLVDASGNPVKHLDPGTYTLLVHDFSTIHNFRLSGPGVDVATDIDGVGDSTFSVTLTDGVYQFQCDAHAAEMRGTFAVGTATLPTTTTSAPPPAPLAKLSAGIGPGSKLTLKGASGLAAGKAKLTVTDRTKTDGFRLSGPGLSRSTGVAFTGTTTWTITLKHGTYSYGSVKHPTLRRTLRVS